MATERSAPLPRWSLVAPPASLVVLAVAWDRHLDLVLVVLVGTGLAAAVGSQCITPRW